VRDEGSVNGTFINDERVIGEQPLKHRDTLRVHTHKYEFEIPELADADRTMLSPKQRRLSS
jgi:pSer/pThr/pTyr-binding forkhead associated (FHA) protein